MDSAPEELWLWICGHPHGPNGEERYEPMPVGTTNPVRCPGCGSDMAKYGSEDYYERLPAWRSMRGH